MGDNTFLKELNKSELKVHDYIKSVCSAQEGSMSESMSSIGEKLDISEATVYRAIRKLSKIGLIGVFPSEGKSESNKMIYYGEYNEEEQVQEVFDLASDLRNNLKRLESLLGHKDFRINQLEKEVKRLESLLEVRDSKILKLEDILANEIDVLKDAKIKDIVELDNGLKAIIFD